MKKEAKLVILMFSGLMFAVFIMLAMFVFVHETSKYNSEWVELGIQKTLSIIELLVGAVAGALSTVLAYSLGGNASRNK